MAERLRDAIAKARAARSGRAASEPSVRAQVSPGIDGITAGAWQALTPIAPNLGRLRGKRIVSPDSSAESAPIDLMRTKIVQQMRANGWRRLAITSPSAGCGKSTVALNLALSLARQEERHTLLIEADFRKPSLLKLLDAPRGPQISEVLAGTAEFADHALRLGGNLAIGANSKPVETPAELIQSRRAAEALERIETIYAPDLMIFDTAPVLVSDDTLSLAAHVDCVLIIAATEETTIQEIDICERELAERTNVMGVVVNKFRFAAPEYGYAYGYGYGAGTEED